MTLKAKLFSTIAAFCLVAVLMVVGVFAASSVKVNMNGQISFTANDVNATIDGAVTGISGAGHTFTQIVFDGSEEGNPYEATTPETDSWTNLNWSFADKTSGKTTGIVFTITVTNTNEDNRAIKSTFDATDILALNRVETTNETNLSVEIKQKGADDADFVAFTGDKAVQIDAGETLQYQITFKILDTNLSVSNQVWQNASITLNNVEA